MKSNERRHISGDTVTEVATDCVAYHFAQFFNGFGLRRNGVSYSSSNISAIAFILLNFKNDFAHYKTLVGPITPSKSEQLHEQIAKRFEQA
jgi:hypothetical protein